MGLQASRTETKRNGNKDRETRKPKNEGNTFKDDSFLIALPKEIWNLIFSRLEKRDLNSLALVSKSFYRFLHFHVPLPWTTLAFNPSTEWVLAMPMNERILTALSLPRFSCLSELYLSRCELFTTPFLSFFFWSSHSILVVQKKKIETVPALNDILRDALKDRRFSTLAIQSSF
jgi:hypothetical protein